MAILAYILFFVPLLAARESKFAMYHASRGLALFLAAMAVGLGGTLIPLIGWFFIVPPGNLAAIVPAVLGIVTVYRGAKHLLPS